MIKKILLFTFFIMFSLMAVNGATSILSCSVVPSSNTDYILEDNFVYNSNNCFNVENKENISFTAQSGLNKTYDFSALSNVAGAKNITFRDINTKTISMYWSGCGPAETDGVHFQNVRFYETGETGLGFYDRGSSTCASGINRFIDDIVINNSYIYNTYSKPLFTATTGDTTTHNTATNLYVQNSQIIDSDLIGFNGWGQDREVNLNIHARIIFYRNNNITNSNLMIRSTSMWSDSICSNNVDSLSRFSSANFQDVAPSDGTGDSPSTFEVGSCIYQSETYENKNFPKNPDKVKYDNEIYILGGMNNFFTADDNEHYILQKPLSLNGTNFFNFLGVSNTILNLEVFANTEALEITAPRGINLGDFNKVYGGNDTARKPQINIDTALNVPFRNTSWGYLLNDVSEVDNYIIEYESFSSVENIDFNLNTLPSLSNNIFIVRPRDISSFLSLGSVDIDLPYSIFDFEFRDNIVDINYDNPALNQSFMVLAQGSKIINNTFDYSRTPSNNQLMWFSGGSTYTPATYYSGGLEITDNTFIGGKYLFSGITAFNTNNVTDVVLYESSILHNDFNKFSTNKAQPFDKGDAGHVTYFGSGLFNGTYKYVTSCNEYNFNIGNYYQDEIDASGCPDTSPNDGFCDVDIFVGTYGPTSDDYFDGNALTTYPYDFDSNLGFGGTPRGICGAFDFTISSPINNVTYNLTGGSSGTFISTYEWTGTLYSEMNCEQRLNNEKKIDVAVNSDELISTQWNVTNGGTATYQVVCFETEDDAKQTTFESDIINFCLGDCNGKAIVSPNPIEYTTILGCTDNTATNYNPSANVDDGSCTYSGGGGGDDINGSTGLTSNILNNINPNDIGGSTDNTIEVIKDAGDLILVIAIPLTIIFIIILVGVIVMGFLK